MAITITAKLDTKGVTDGAKDVEKSIKGMGDQADRSNDKLEQVAKELFDQLEEIRLKNETLKEQLGVIGDGGSDSLKKVERSAETVATELRNAANGGRELVTSLRDAGIQATDTASGVNFDEIVEGIQETEVQVNVSTTKSIEDIGRIGETAKKTGEDISASSSSIQSTVTALSTGYLAVVDVLKKGYQAALKFDAVMRNLSENGNEGASKIVTQLDKIWERLDQIGNDPTTQHVFDGMADGAGVAEKAMGGLMSAWTTFTNLNSAYALLWAENLGIVSEGAMEARREMQKIEDDERQSFEARKKRAEDEKKAAKEEEDRKKKITDLEGDLERVREEFNGSEEERQVARLKTEDEVIRLIRDQREELRLLAEQNKLTDEAKEHGLDLIRAAEKRLADEKEKLNREREEDAKRVEEAERSQLQQSEDARNKAHDEELKRIEDEVKARQKAESDKIEAERQALEERKRLLTGGGDDSEARKLLGAQSRERVRDAFAAKKAEEAAGALDSSGASQSEVAAGRRKALAQARRQFDQGTANPEEVRAVQVELANATADSAVRQGKASNETAQAAKEAIAELARVQNEQERLQSEMSNMRQIMAGVTRQGNRRRAQVQGGQQ